MIKIRQDFLRWDEFKKIPRPVLYVENGVLEIMPICDNEYYAYKYVNCHPKNPFNQLMTVVSTAQLATVDDGYPLLISEMILLTALCTAATSALATDLLANKNAKTIAVIGTCAQSEFQGLAYTLILSRD